MHIIFVVEILGICILYTKLFVYIYIVHVWKLFQQLRSLLYLEHSIQSNTNKFSNDMVILYLFRPWPHHETPLKLLVFLWSFSPSFSLVSSLNDHDPSSLVIHYEMHRHRFVFGFLDKSFLASFSNWSLWFLSLMTQAGFSPLLATSSWRLLELVCTQTPGK